VQQERGNNERQRTRKQNLKTWRTRPDWRFTKPYDLSYDYLKFSVRSTYDSDLKRANKRFTRHSERKSPSNDTIRDAILTRARKPTWVSLIYRTETE